MAVDDWPEQDRAWAGRYVLGLARLGVPLSSTDARQDELIAAARDAGVPAADLFGDPAEAAAADAPDLNDADATAEDADGAGAREALAYGGTALIFIGVIAAAMLLIGGGGPVDVTVGMLAVTFAIVTALVVGGAAAMQFVAGRLRIAAYLAAVAIGAVLVGGSQVTWSGRGVVVVADLPRWGAALALLVPGVLAILIARRVPRRAPQTTWSDEEWFARFRGVLISKGTPGTVVREHERSLREGLTSTAADEYGRPDSLALQLVAADPAAQSRRMWWGAAGWMVFALLQATFIPGETGAWLVFRVAFTVFLLALAGRSVLRARRARPASSSKTPA
ncbi:Uncharacterised protein [Tsukamurella tyrosinosolvens]|uniref:Uncharacterized protein n=1 Tax=Tsukamurella tyrosinosolvens TaxID=57704 RepID=A0A1H4LWU4_TSUTY|nr:hypothetical protein [Tsukamurella tyrosinosolvens]KXO96736.1 hypothetical protein AXK58_05485 [Tsukamurella tyrosinosolvens]SEB75037.1 hypothetical protein SAMN04489793_0719 [Tsukamurella tyrosinosolvens]VEH88523.1 Uncharacterised protein [Tsukamurella tyrosinosolvens]